jgi:putative aldouronate transport system permease protein
MRLIVFTMFFSGGLIPVYLLVKAMGLLNTRWPLLLHNAIITFNFIIMRTGFAAMPDSLEESAKLDGANDITILFRIVFPLSTAVLATMALFSVVYHWNEWFMGIIYVSDPKKLPVMVILYQILRQAARSIRDETWAAEKVPPSVSIRMALIVVTAFPVVVAYPFFQKYFIKGMLIGSIKG